MVFGEVPAFDAILKSPERLAEQFLILSNHLVGRGRRSNPEMAP